MAPRSWACLLGLLLACRQSYAYEARPYASAPPFARGRPSPAVAPCTQSMRLPSLRKFESSFHRCERRFLERCTGPAKPPNAERLERAWARARRAFGHDYNDRLFTGLLVAALAAVVLFRFVIKVQLLEGAAAGGCSCWRVQLLETRRKHTTLRDLDV
ncbi:hypothetical protein TSOC_005957 [Tetrabaena socialis]|uniref:Uncharacterized protein n=1 Tax=Tetrabaena socialis TaxID=47790 RepID=A0A2J8A4Z0_9CHLO|nr:hypothetical protein TSOC_005957 [Tetrabaena socialis]|eukprot:PNH07580.1 hypothetical protein TSOC_005957 [Tetrabaena socialis]